MPRPVNPRDTPPAPPPALVPVLSVGVSDVSCPIAFLEKGIVAYVCGRFVATISADPAEFSRVSEPHPDVRHINGMTVSPNKKFLAIAEFMAGGRAPQVTVLNTQLERLTSLTATGAFKYVNLCFSGDGKVIAAVGYDEEVKNSIFHCWDWETSTHASCAGETARLVRSISLHPKFSSNLVTQAPDDFSLWRWGTSGFKRHGIHGLQRKGSTLFIDHCWLPDGRLVVATSDRHLYIVETNEVVQTHMVVLPVVCIMAMPDSTVAVSMLKGQVQLFRCRRESNKAELLAVLQAPEAMKTSNSDNEVSFMSLNENGKKAACYCKSGPVSIANFEFGLSASMSKEDVAESWEEVIPPMHSAAILSASLASTRDFIATASQDLTVRVWQYNPLRLVLLHFCHISPLAVGIDPWGRELVICYLDSTRVYSVVEGMLMDLGPLLADRRGIVSSHPDYHPQDMEKCSLVKYNPTGHLIALVGGGAWRGFSANCNNNIVLIYSTLFKSQLAVLRGHATQIIDLAWSADGLYLCSCSETAVITWDMETFTKHQDSTNKVFFNSAAACSPDFNTIIIGHSGQGLRIMGTQRPQPARFLLEDDTKKQALASMVHKSPTRAQKVQAPFRVPGSSHAAAPPVVTTTVPGFKKAAKTTMMALSRMNNLAMSERGMADKLVETPRSQEERELGEGELIPRSHYSAIMQPQHQGLAVAETEEFQCIISADLTVGHVRVCSINPRGDEDYDEYAPHVSDITQLIVHPKGRLVFTTDSHGVWCMHCLVPRELFMPSAKSHSPLPGADSDGDGPAAAQALTFTLLHSMARSLMAKEAEKSASGEKNEVVVSVRSSDLVTMKDSVREWKDRFGKAATAFEYKMYQREQDIRREMEVELKKLHEEALLLREEVRDSKDVLQSTVNSQQQREQEMKAVHKQSTMDERQIFDHKLSNEIERANLAENENQRLKAKFGKTIWDMDDAQKQTNRDHKGEVVKLEDRMVIQRAKADQKLAKNKDQMDLEIRLDGEMNEEELTRAGTESANIIKNREELLMDLRTKYTIQVGLTNKTHEANEMLQKTNDQLVTENERLEECILGLTEELETMHLAWADRDNQKRVQDDEMKEMMQRVQQGQLYSQVAAGRIQDLNAEIQPLRVSKAAANESLVELEAAQMRLAERRKKADEQYLILRNRLERAHEETQAVKFKLHQKESYMDNFTTQLFRMVHNVEPSMWPIIFGKLHQDFAKGKDKSDWSKYLIGTSKEVKDRTPAKDVTETIHIQDYPASAAQSHAPTVNFQIEASMPSLMAQQSTVNFNFSTQPSMSASTFTAAGSRSQSRNGSPDRTRGQAGPQATQQERILQEKLLTHQEWSAQIEELASHVRHSEKVIQCNKESSDKRDVAQKSVIQKLVADNSVVLDECNTLKKRIKELKEQVDKKGAELMSYKMEASKHDGPNRTPSALAHSRLSKLGSPGAGPHGTPPRATSGLPTSSSDGPGPGSRGEMSAQEMLAAAAANAAAQRAGEPPVRQSSPSHPDGTSLEEPWGRSASASATKQPMPSPRGGPLVASSSKKGHGSSAEERQSALDEALPPSTSVTGDMPSGGWWLSEGNPFAGQSDGSLGILRAGGGEESGPSSKNRRSPYNTLGAMVKNRNRTAASGEGGHGHFSRRGGGGSRAKTAAPSQGSHSEAQSQQQVPQTVLMPRHTYSANSRRPIMYAQMSASADAAATSTWSPNAHRTSAASSLEHPAAGAGIHQAQAGFHHSQAQAGLHQAQAQAQAGSNQAQAGLHQSLAQAQAQAGSHQAQAQAQAGLHQSLAQAQAQAGLLQSLAQEGLHQAPGPLRQCYQEEGGGEEGRIMQRRVGDSSPRLAAASAASTGGWGHAEDEEGSDSSLLLAVAAAAGADVVSLDGALTLVSNTDGGITMAMANGGVPKNARARSAAVDPAFRNVRPGSTRYRS